MQSPFPYFGGKSRISDEIWRRFGTDLDNYVEPFYGSGAVHLAAPYIPKHETINDVDAFVANFWRAVQENPEGLAQQINWPVNEADQEARHKWMCQRERKAEFTERVKTNPEFHDLRYAAWWCWGLCCWIGSGWCDGEWVGPGSDDNRGCQLNSKNGKLPHLGSSKGVHRKLPHLGSSMGVHRIRPQLSNADVGECARREQVMIEWMQQLCNRLRNVRVCCGDWSRVLTPCPTFALGITGVFLDPPYGEAAGRRANIYSEDCLEVAVAVRQWCLDAGKNPLMRIALCGYEGERHEELEAHGWAVFQWEASGGYACIHGKLSEERAYLNKKKERIWFSPACLRESTLFDGYDQTVDPDTPDDMDGTDGRLEPGRLGDSVAADLPARS